MSKFDEFDLDLTVVKSNAAKIGGGLTADGVLTNSKDTRKATDFCSTCCTGMSVPCSKYC